MKEKLVTNIKIIDHFICLSVFIKVEEQRMKMQRDAEILKQKLLEEQKRREV